VRALREVATAKVPAIDSVRIIRKPDDVVTEVMVGGIRGMWALPAGRRRTNATTGVPGGFEPSRAHRLSCI
jgi:hypothetical protein